MITQEKKQDVMSSQRAEPPVTREEMRAFFREQAPGQAPTKTWRPAAGGILAITAGYFNILMGVAEFYVRNISTFAGLNTTLVVTAGVALIALGVYSIIGGSLAIARRGYGWALAGSITATLLPNFLWIPGVLSLICVGVSKNEFRK